MTCMLELDNSTRGGQVAHSTKGDGSDCCPTLKYVGPTTQAALPILEVSNMIDEAMSLGLQAGEELLLDYGRMYWRGRENKELD